MSDQKLIMYRKREYCLIGEKVVLVPYSVHHVEKYHQWMQDPFLQSQTASEPLTLEKEYEMQESWMKDQDKCTFIILSKHAYHEKKMVEIDCMAGDVNVFFSDDSGGVDGTTAEIEIMIAEPTHRGKGLGLEATKLMIAYGILELGVRKYRAKIGVDNQPSLNLFQNKLSFSEVSCSDVFKEVTLELEVNAELVELYRKFFQLSGTWSQYELKTT